MKKLSFRLTLAVLVVGASVVGAGLAFAQAPADQVYLIGTVCEFVPPATPGAAPSPAVCDTINLRIGPDPTECVDAAIALRDTPHLASALALVPRLLAGRLSLRCYFGGVYIDIPGDPPAPPAPLTPPAGGG